MGWIAAAVLLILILLLPIGVRVIYDEAGGTVWISAGPVYLCVYPGKDKPKGTQKARESGAEFAKTKRAKNGGSYADFLPIVEDVIELLLVLRRKIRVRRLEMKLVMAGDDPCDLAVNYGKAWMALGNLIPVLERVFIIQKRNLEVQCDFTERKTVIYARLDITLELIRLLGIVLRHGTRILKKYQTIFDKRKGGVKL